MLTNDVGVVRLIIISSRSLLSEEICPDLCVYMVFMNMNF